MKENVCPLLEYMKKAHIPELSPELINNIRRNTTPICFHCGENYIVVKAHSDETSTVWRPTCKCLSTTAVRVVTG